MPRSGFDRVFYRVMGQSRRHHASGPEPRRPLGVRPPVLVRLDPEREERAVEALATLLRPLLAGGATALKDTVEGTCDGPAVPAGADPPPTAEDAQ